MSAVAAGLLGEMDRLKAENERKDAAIREALLLLGRCDWTAATRDALGILRAALTEPSHDR